MPIDPGTPVPYKPTIQMRRQLGRYDTPRPLSQAIVDWAVRSPNADVIEPSSGSGVFVRSILHRLRELGRDQPECKVWACDIDSAACLQTASSGKFQPDHIINGDFLSLLSGGAFFLNRKFDCVVGNPPYVSLHRMSSQQRQAARSAAERLNISLDKKASLWAYFIIGATCILKEKGNLAMILPESILHADYARGLMRVISRYYSKCFLLSIRERCFLNDGADERVVALLGESLLAENAETEILLHECETAQEAAGFLSALPTNQGTNLLARMNGHAVPHLIAANASVKIDLDKVPGIQTLGQLAEIKIGVVTGANDFFLLTEAERKQWHLRESSLTPILPRFRACDGLEFCKEDWERLRDSGERCWIISPSEQDISIPLHEYLDQYPIEKRTTNRTFEKRNLWYSTEMGEQPHAFLRYMGTIAPRLALAGFDVTCTNTIHRVYFKSRNSLFRKAIALSLLSSFSQLSAEYEGRAYGSGVLKLEPSEAKRIKVLLPTSLAKGKVAKYFTSVERAMLDNGPSAATKLVDDWLYDAIPDLERALQRAELQKALYAAVKRRLGKVPLFTVEVVRKSS